VPLPETIPVKYTEEEADYVSMRPLVRQNFRATELVDMIVRVAGKDLLRMQQILRSGTVVFQSYRYWWQGFEAGEAALADLLAVYPNADPSRPFRAKDCTEVMFEEAAAAKRHPVRVTREEANKKGLLRSRSLWDCWMELAVEAGPKYRDYSYALSGDVYVVALTAEQAARVMRDVEKLAGRALRARLAALGAIERIAFVCSRHGGAGEAPLRD
jgi:hypothetical protein